MSKSSHQTGNPAHIYVEADLAMKERARMHSLPIFRATGITNYLENGGTLEVAQRIAGYADSRTTKLYHRRGQKVLVEDMERVRY
jgi:integrase/recombinase XerD